MTMKLLNYVVFCSLVMTCCSSGTKASSICEYEGEIFPRSIDLNYKVNIKIEKGVAFGIISGISRSKGEGVFNEKFPLSAPEAMQFCQDQFFSIPENLELSTSPAVFDGIDARFKVRLDQSERALEPDTIKAYSFTGKLSAELWKFLRQNQVKSLPATQHWQK